MIWFLTLSLVSVHDSGMGSLDTRAIDNPTYRIQITGAEGRRDYVRPVKEVAVLDAMSSLPQKLIPKLTKAKIGILRGGQYLEVDWRRIVFNGESATNYQLFVGDVIVVEFCAPGQ